MSFSDRTSWQALVQQVNIASGSLTPSAVTTGTTGSSTLAVPNSQLGDLVDVSAPAAIGNLVMQGEVTAAGTVTIKFANTTAGSITPPAGVYRVITYTLTALANS